MESVAIWEGHETYDRVRAPEAWLPRLLGHHSGDPRACVRLAAAPWTRVGCASPRSPTGPVQKLTAASDTRTRVIAVNWRP